MPNFDNVENDGKNTNDPRGTYRVRCRVKAAKVC